MKRRNQSFGAVEFVFALSEVIANEEHCSRLSGGELAPRGIREVEYQDLPQLSYGAAPLPRNPMNFNLTAPLVPGASRGGGGTDVAVYGVDCKNLALPILCFVTSHIRTWQTVLNSIEREQKL